MGLFSLAGREDDNRDIIELVSCRWNGQKCSGVRREINRLLRSARKSRLNKEYRRAVDEISEAYFLTDQVTDGDCQGCLSFFRETMLNSMILIDAELKRMSSGLFRGKRYQEASLFASQKVDELKKHQQSKTQMQ